jgi:hypothetical protein
MYLKVIVARFVVYKDWICVEWVGWRAERLEGLL